MSITLALITIAIAHNAPSWLAALRDTVLTKSREVAYRLFLTFREQMSL